jgi:CheY-like chemotaxis protein
VPPLQSPHDRTMSQVISDHDDGLASAASARWQSSVRGGATTKLNRRCVLVIDDDPDSREALAMLLSWGGLEVHVASGGEDGLFAAAQYLPQLILLDIAMPDLNGYDVCRRLRLSPPFEHATIFALSAFSGELHDTRCSEAGFTGQLTKPFDPVAFEKVLGLPRSSSN